MAIKDFLPIFKKRKLVFLKKRKEPGDISSYYFNTNEEFHWRAGQHGIFSLPNIKVEGKSWRFFSLASAPHEEDIMISTRLREPLSGFKSKLDELQPGDPLTMRGPFGHFYISEPEVGAIFVAGGIGITPFRSLIMESLS